MLLRNILPESLFDEPELNPGEPLDAGFHEQVGPSVTAYGGAYPWTAVGRTLRSADGTVGRPWGSSDPSRRYAPGAAAVHPCPATRPGRMGSSWTKPPARPSI